MNNKLLFAIVTMVLFAGAFTLFITVANAAGTNLSCTNKQKILVTLKDNAKIDAAKNKISKIPKVKIIKIQDRDKEWSKMVNKMDLPKMENPFKHEITVKTSKKANVDEIYNQIKAFDFVENVQYVSAPECTEKQK